MTKTVIKQNTVVPKVSWRDAVEFIEELGNTNEATQFVKLFVAKNWKAIQKRFPLFSPTKCLYTATDFAVLKSWIGKIFVDGDTSFILSDIRSVKNKWEMNLIFLSFFKDEQTIETYSWQEVSSVDIKARTINSRLKMANDKQSEKLRKKAKDFIGFVDSFVS